MRRKSILTETQALYLKIFGKQSFSEKFYLTGGTALAEFYIPYRFSEDLDFFSEFEIDTSEVSSFMKSIKAQLGFKTYEFNTSFNRNIFLLNFVREELKIEFTYYPFPQLENPKIKLGIKIDSIEDIAVNKLFTIYQNPRFRDFTDLYMIQKKYKFPITTLIKSSKTKFDWHVDYLKLGTQFLKIKTLKDYPRMLIPFDFKECEEFWINETKRLRAEIMK